MYAEEIYVVILEHFKSDKEAQKVSKITKDYWSKIERLKRVVESPNPGFCDLRDKLSKTIPHRKPIHFPKLVFFYPRSKSLGNFLTGTLNFNGEYASKIMERGYLETLHKLDETKNKQ